MTFPINVNQTFVSLCCWCPRPRPRPRAPR